MKQGVYGTIEKLKRELQRQRAARQDLVADTRCLAMETKDGCSTLSVTTENGDMLYYEVNPLAHRQIADRLKIPFGYYEKMQQSAPALLDRNVNNWFQQTPETRMLRILDGNLRAFLSSRYRRLDNLELLQTVLPEIEKLRGAYIDSMDVTDTHLYIKVVNKSLKSEIDVGDIVYSGFVLSNSEVGKGAINVSPMLFRKVCSNGLIINQLGNRKYHAGKTVEDTDSAYELYSDETMALDNATYFSKAKDIIKATVNEIDFERICGQLRTAKNVPMGENPMATVEFLADRYVLSKQEKASVLMHYLRDEGQSLYGLTNAVTRTAQEADSYNRSVELEKIGGVLLQEGINSSFAGKKGKSKIAKEQKNLLVAA